MVQVKHSSSSICSLIIICIKLHHLHRASRPHPSLHAYEPPKPPTPCSKFIAVYKCTYVYFLHQLRVASCTAQTGFLTMYDDAPRHGHQMVVTSIRLAVNMNDETAHGESSLPLLQIAFDLSPYGPVTPTRETIV